jgi:hypothetical protein
MMFATRLFPLLTALLAPLCGSAQTTDYEVGTSLICDTQTQVERFVALFSGDTQAAIDAVNAQEKNPTACALVAVAYLRGAESRARQSRIKLAANHLLDRPRTCPRIMSSIGLTLGPGSRPALRNPAAVGTDRAW